MGLWSRICIKVGYLCIPFAVFLHIFTGDGRTLAFFTWYGRTYDYPYRGFALPLAFLGFVLILVGRGLRGQERIETDRNQQEKQKKKRRRT